MRFRECVHIKSTSIRQRGNFAIAIGAQKPHAGPRVTRDDIHHRMSKLISFSDRNHRYAGSHRRDE
jgi:hypothetical protein